MRKTPAYTHIISYLGRENVFLHMDEILLNQILQTGDYQSRARLAVYSNLLKLKRRRILVTIDQPSGQRLWGFPSWIDSSGKPLRQHILKEEV